jgi:hypothetical protein
MRAEVIRPNPEQPPDYRHPLAGYNVRVGLTRSNEQELLLPRLASYLTQCLVVADEADDSESVGVYEQRVKEIDAFMQDAAGVPNSSLPVFVLSPSEAELAPDLLRNEFIYFPGLEDNVERTRQARQAMARRITRCLGEGWVQVRQEQLNLVELTDSNVVVLH